MYGFPSIGYEFATIAYWFGWKECTRVGMKIENKINVERMMLRVDKMGVWAFYYDEVCKKKI